MAVFLERIARTVGTDGNFSRTGSLSRSKGQFFFEWIARAVRTDTKSFTTISNFVYHEIRGICVLGAQCIKVSNGPLRQSHKETFQIIN